MGQTTVFQSIVSTLLAPGSASTFEAQIAKNHQAIASVMDMGGALAVRASGEVIEVIWDHPEEATVITDQREINIAYFALSEKYPELAGLAPKQPEGAPACKACRGTGKVDLPTHLQAKLRCWCGGLGWVPDEGSQIRSRKVEVRARSWWKRR